MKECRFVSYNLNCIEAKIRKLLREGYTIELAPKNQRYPFGKKQ